MANQNDVKRALSGDRNLSGADLRGTNFPLMSLSKADFTGADLRGADLSKVDLAGADFTGANLEGAEIPLIFTARSRHKGKTINEYEAIGLPQHATTEDIAIYIASRRGVDESWAELDDRIDHALRSLKLQINTLDIKRVTQLFDNIEIIGSPGPRKRKIVITYNKKGKTLSVERVGGKRRSKKPTKRGNEASKMLNQLNREISELKRDLDK